MPVLVVGIGLLFFFLHRRERLRRRLPLFGSPPQDRLGPALAGVVSGPEPQQQSKHLIQMQQQMMLNSASPAIAIQAASQASQDAQQTVQANHQVINQLLANPLVLQQMQAMGLQANPQALQQMQAMGLQANHQAVNQLLNNPQLLQQMQAMASSAGQQQYPSTNARDAPTSARCPSRFPSNYARDDCTNSARQTSSRSFSRCRRKLPGRDGQKILGERADKM